VLGIFEIGFWELLAQAGFEFALSSQDYRREPLVPGWFHYILADFFFFFFFLNIGYSTG
jgi:hypothetical protein